MPYYTGSAVSESAMVQALIDGCTSNGFTWNDETGPGEPPSGMLYNAAANIYLQIGFNHSSGYNNTTFLGRTGVASGDAPNVVMMGKLDGYPSRPTLELSYPLTYELFIFTAPVVEVYFVVRYDIDRFQWVAFGQSTVSLPGTGMWLGATLGPQYCYNILNSADGPIGIKDDDAGYAGSTSRINTSAALAMTTGWANGYREGSRNFVLHNDFEGAAWEVGPEGSLSGPVGIRYATDLLRSQPTAWSGETALLPLQAYKVRPAQRISLIMDCVNARLLRIDHFAPGDVIDLGGEQWMVFPWHKKSIENRDGTINVQEGRDHSGTFGWAIRYEAP